MFSRRLGREEGEAPFGIVLEGAFVASARSSCLRCGHDIEVICIYCRYPTKKCRCDRLKLVNS
jgi:hypothetical protein